MKTTNYTKNIIKISKNIVIICCISSVYYALMISGYKERYVYMILFTLILILYKITNIVLIRFITKAIAIILIIYSIFINSALVLLNYYIKKDTNVVHGITKEKILSIQIGMNKKDLIDILGKPIKIKNYGDKKNAFVYAEPRNIGLGFEFYINTVNDKVVLIMIECSDLWVYMCTRNDCRIINNDALDDLVSLSLKK